MDCKVYDSSEELLKTVIENESGQEVASVNFLDCNKDYFVSSQKKAKVTLKSGEELDIFVKTMSPSSPGYFLDQMLQFCEREHVMYRLLKSMADYQESVLNSATTPFDQEILIKNLFPKYYGRGYTGDVLHLIMEDFITHQSFEVTSIAKKNVFGFHTLEQVNSVMKCIGAFHAVSYVMKTKPLAGMNPTNFAEEYPLLDLDDVGRSPEAEAIIAMFTTKNYVYTLNILEAVNQAVANNDPTAVANLKSGKSPCSTEDILRLKAMAPKMLDILHPLLLKEEPGAVVNHGDFHLFNMAFAGETVKFFDLQLGRYTSGMLDVCNYITMATTPEFRSKHFSVTLSTYLTSFNNFCNAAGVKPLYNNAEELRSEYLAKTPSGLCYGLFLNFMMCVQNPVAFDKVAEVMGVEKGMLIPTFGVALDATKRVDTGDGDNATIMEELSNCGTDIWWSIQLLLDLVHEASQQGTIDLIETVYNEL